MKAERNRWSVLGVAILALAFLAYLAFSLHRQSTRQSLSRIAGLPITADAHDSLAKASAITAKALRASLGRGPVTPQDLEKARKAFDDLRAVESRIATATSYRRVVRQRNPDGTYTDSTAYYKKASNGVNLYRLIESRFDPGSEKPAREISEEIFNSQGAFYVENGADSQPIAFLLTDAANSEANVRQTTIALASSSSATLAEDKLLNYSESQNVAPDGTAETLIDDVVPNPASPVADLQFRIGNQSGNITSQVMYGQDGQEFSSVEFPSVDIDPQLDDAFFDIPPGAPVVLAANRGQAILLAASIRASKSKH
jgi:hypothetical protein